MWNVAACVREFFCCAVTHLADLPAAPPRCTDVMPLIRVMMSRMKQFEFGLSVSLALFSFSLVTLSRNTYSVLSELSELSELYELSVLLRIPRAVEVWRLPCSLAAVLCNMFMFDQMAPVARS